MWISESLALACTVIQILQIFPIFGERSTRKRHTFVMVNEIKTIALKLSDGFTQSSYVYSQSHKVTALSNVSTVKVQI